MSIPNVFAALVDDAAIYPPGSLPLSAAVPVHAAHRHSPVRDLVGPFVVGTEMNSPSRPRHTPAAVPGEEGTMTAVTRPEPTDGAQTLERGLAVLVELSRHADGLTTAQTAAACGLHRSITTRLLVSLQRTGFAHRDEAGAYRIGPAVFELLGLARPHLREVAAPILNRLARTVDATASLVEIVDGYAVTTLVAEPPSDGPRYSYRLGNRDPLDRGAGGLAALAAGPPQPTEPDRVTAARTHGYITTHSELNLGAHAIAAPLPGWGTLTAINIVTNRPEVIDVARTPLLDAVREISTHTADEER